MVFDAAMAKISGYTNQEVLGRELLESSRKGSAAGSNASWP